MKTGVVLSGLLALMTHLPAQADYFTPIHFQKGHFSATIHYRLPANEEGNSC